MKETNEPGHEKYDHVTKITLSVTTESYLFIGNGISQLYLEDPSILEKNIFTMQPQVLMNIAKNPASKIMVLDVPLSYPKRKTYVIPGSSIKGLARSRTELYANEDDHCYSVLDKRGKNIFFDPKAKTHHELFDITRQTRFKPMDGTCWICNIFGAMSIQKKPKGGTIKHIKKGKIMINDAVYNHNHKNNPPPKAIMLKSFGNKEILAYQPNTKFTTTITMLNLSKTDEASVLQALGVLDNETRLMGYSKYTNQLNEQREEISFGVVKFTMTSMKYFTPAKYGVLNLTKKAVTSEAIKNALNEYKKHATRLTTQDEGLVMLTLRKSGNRSRSRRRY